MIFKIDNNTDCSFIYRPLQIISNLSNHNDNLVKATVKNIIVSAINLCDNKTLSPFMQSFDFHNFVIKLVKEILETTEIIEKLILTPKKEKELQNRIMDLNDLIEYLRDVLISLNKHFPQLFNFTLFLFQLFYMVQLVLPLLRYDLNIKSHINIGLNCGLFVMNNLICLFENYPELEQIILLPLFFRDKMLSPWVKNFDFNIILNANQIINFYYKFNDNKLSEKDNARKNKFSLFTSKPKRFEQLKIKEVSSDRQINIFKKEEVFIDIKKQMVPRVFNIMEEAKKHDLKRGSKVKHSSKLLECLVSFLKTKDDNMLLLSSNIVLQILKNFKLKKNLTDSIADKCSENLVTEIKFRLITYENIAKLLASCYCEDFNEPKWKIIDGLKSKLSIMNQILEKVPLNKKFTEIFYKVCYDYDSGLNMFDSSNLIPRQKSLNYLSLINYSFYEDFKKLKYLSLFYKYHLSDVEIIESEIRIFLILKNLRYTSTL